MKQWRQSSEPEFWRKFSDTSGQKLLYTAIVDHLTQARKEEDRKMADRARACEGCTTLALGIHKFRSVPLIREPSNFPSNFQKRSTYLNGKAKKIQGSNNFYCHSKGLEKYSTEHPESIKPWGIQQSKNFQYFKWKRPRNYKKK